MLRKRPERFRQDGTFGQERVIGGLNDVDLVVGGQRALLLLPALSVDAQAPESLQRLAEESRSLRQRNFLGFEGRFGEGAKNTGRFLFLLLLFVAPDVVVVPLRAFFNHRSRRRRRPVFGSKKVRSAVGGVLDIVPVVTVSLNVMMAKISVRSFPSQTLRGVRDDGSPRLMLLLPFPLLDLLLLLLFLMFRMRRLDFTTQRLLGRRWALLGLWRLRWLIR